MMHVIEIKLNIHIKGTQGKTRDETQESRPRGQGGKHHDPGTEMSVLTWLTWHVRCHKPGQMSHGVAGLVLFGTNLTPSLDSQFRPSLQTTGKWGKKALVSYETHLKTLKNINSYI